MRPSLSRRCIETVSARDLFLKNITMNSTKKSLAFTPPRHVMSPNDAPDHPVYSNIVERLSLDPDMETLLQKRTSRVQDFLGPDMTLSFPELLSVICGLSNMDINVSTERGSSVFKQDVVRALGSRFFAFQCMSDTIFDDLQHLSRSADEIDNSLELFADFDLLAMRFMKLNALDKCVLPYRGAHSAGFAENADSIRETVTRQSSVASFYTMLGLLVVKFGSREVLHTFWPSKILNSNSGILRIIASKDYS